MTALSVAPTVPRPDNRMPRARRRRSVPHLVLGVLLVVGCGLGFAAVALQLGGLQAVLVVARDVPVGRVIEPGDVRVVRLATDPGVDVVLAASAGTVVGQAAAVPLTAGMVLTRAAVGLARVPGPGQGVAAVALKAGQFPPGLSTGASVAVLLGSATDARPAGSGSVVSLPAVVVAVDGGEPTVVSMQLPERDARQVAAAPAGSVSLALLPPEAGR